MVITSVCRYRTANNNIVHKQTVNTLFMNSNYKGFEPHEPYDLSVFNVFFVPATIWREISLLSPYLPPGDGLLIMMGVHVLVGGFPGT